MIVCLYLPLHIMTLLDGRKKKLRNGASSNNKNTNLGFDTVVRQLPEQIVSFGLNLVVPRPVRLRLRGDEPEVFPKLTRAKKGQAARVAKNMSACKVWTYLDRVL